MRTVALGLFLVVTPSLALKAQDSAVEELAAPALERSDLARWRLQIRPAEDELGFDQIDWISTFSEGLAHASKERRPLLFWAMNGHPLGCT